MRRRWWCRRGGLEEIALEDVAPAAEPGPPHRQRHRHRGLRQEASRAGVLPGLIKRKGELWLGTLARPARRSSDTARAGSRLCRCPSEWQLVILGEGPERAAIEPRSRSGSKIEHRVHLPGFVADPAQAVGLFDIFALSSKSEQFPISVVEAMAAGLPVARARGGRHRRHGAGREPPVRHARGRRGGAGDALRTLAADPGTRAAIGAINREKARKAYDETHMIEHYRRLYAAAMGSRRPRLTAGLHRPFTRPRRGEALSR